MINRIPRNPSGASGPVQTYEKFITGIRAQAYPGYHRTGFTAGTYKVYWQRSNIDYGDGWVNMGTSYGASDLFSIPMGYEWSGSGEFTKTEPFSIYSTGDGEQIALALYKVEPGTGNPEPTGNAVFVHGYFDNPIDSRPYAGVYEATDMTYGSLGRYIFKCTATGKQMWQDGDYWHIGQLVYLIGGGWDPWYVSGTANGKTRYVGMSPNWNDAYVAWSGTRWEYWENVMNYETWESVWTLVDTNSSTSDTLPTSGWSVISFSLGADPYGWGDTRTAGTGIKPPVGTPWYVSDGYSPDMCYCIDTSDFTAGLVTTEDSTYIRHTFYTSDSITFASAVVADVLIVGAAFNNTKNSTYGGGNGGGVQYVANMEIPAGTYSAVVGLTGSSSFNGVTAGAGGGAGGTSGSPQNNPTGAMTYYSLHGSGYSVSGGGGGAGGPGTNAVGGENAYRVCGSGGPGLTYDISGANKVYGRGSSGIDQWGGTTCQYPDEAETLNTGNAGVLAAGYNSGIVIIRIHK